VTNLEIARGPARPHLEDALGRRLDYLRLSLTDRCNLRCSYCLPGGCPRAGDVAAPLAVAEIERLVRAFA
jgi:cyclic pyranopterin phosphate synthase